MSDFYTFNGIPFVMVVPGSGETPHWAVALDATDRKLIGTDRFERTIRSRQYRLEGELWVEPNAVLATAEGSWRALQDAYVGATLAALVSPAGTTKSCIIVAFDVVPLRGGVDGYRGKVVFGLPGGMA
ncbi:hypothetical protein EKD04_009650 [Chloroflexales bacterium ZM16-3]|nr:hypothetical protein [Chloroflexales bacterium ZM16-3]